MFRRSKEEIISIVGKALKKGNPKLRVETYTRLEEIIFWDSRSSAPKTDWAVKTLEALLEYLGLEEEIPNAGVKLKKKKKKRS